MGLIRVKLGKTPRPIWRVLLWSRLRRIPGPCGHEYTAVGEKGDISYGQAKAGPTDTLDIDFIGDHWNELPQELQGVLERGGKAWSYRLSVLRGETGSGYLPTGRGTSVLKNTACGALLSLKESRWREGVQDAATWYKRGQAVSAGGKVEKDQAYFAAHELGHVLVSFTMMQVGCPAVFA